MNRDEKIANNYLKQQDFSQIVYEPDGNIPPDFLLDNSIAVEVRRLNQHQLVNGVYKPIEELGYKLIPRIVKVLQELEIDNFDKSILVTVYFKRPLKVDSKLIKQIKSKFEDKIPLLENEIVININNNLQLKLYLSKIKFSKSISIGAIHDFDTGGVIVSEIYKSIKIVLKEKEEKIQSFHHKYRTWWLILVDYIGYQLESIDVKQLNNAPRLKTIFDKVILISSINNNKANEIIVDNASA